MEGQVDSQDGTKRVLYYFQDPVVQNKTAAQDTSEPQHTQSMGVGH
ncbi:hypothetical protein [Bacillus cereus]|nr:hypothetical protein [Bacillus cereus]